VLVALWVTVFGPRRVAKPRLSVSVELAPPDCMWNPAPGEGTGGGRTRTGHYDIRLRVTNEGNEDARDVEVMMIRLRRLSDSGKWLTDPSFLPLLLPWSWWVANEGPARWLERLPTGTFKHCDLLTVTLEHDSTSSSRGRQRQRMNGASKPWMTFRPAYDTSRSYGQNLMRKPPGRYKLEFVAAMSNAPAIYLTAHMSFTGWRDTLEEMFSDNGGFNIEIARTTRP
jgi:hypothetical protein